MGWQVYDCHYEQHVSPRRGLCAAPLEVKGCFSVTYPLRGLDQACSCLHTFGVPAYLSVWLTALCASNKASSGGHWAALAVRVCVLLLQAVPGGERLRALSRSPPGSRRREGSPLFLPKSSGLQPDHRVLHLRWIAQAEEDWTRSVTSLGEVRVAAELHVE